MVSCYKKETKKLFFIKENWHIPSMFEEINTYPMMFKEKQMLSQV